MIKCKLFPCFLFVMLLSSSQSELFSAVVDLEKLIYTEGEIVRILDEYLEIEEQRLEKVRWFRSRFNELHESLNEDVENFLFNPINGYLLVKRLTTDWNAAMTFVQELDGKALIENTIHRQDLVFPDDNDFNGASRALLRLQETYRLNTTFLALGVLKKGMKATTKLTADDCYELGISAFSTKNYHLAEEWMQEAFLRIHQEIQIEDKRTSILECAATSAFKQGKLHDAVKWTEHLLIFVPDHERGLVNIAYFRNLLAEPKTHPKDEETYIDSKPKTKTTKSDKREKYYRLCRGEVMLTEHSHALQCRYFTNENPLLLLQPVQEEELYLSPRIVVYHNILSEREMDVIKTLAKPMLERGRVRYFTGKDLTYFRTSKCAWITESMHPVIAQIDRRIEAVTGLTMETAENLQVGNYGIGGYYDPHFDYFTAIEDNVLEYLQPNDRIATWLNYMGDVSAGGATVFTEIEAHVKPEKGSAVFWFNLHKSGKVDNRTRHAACPVLAGSKWVANKWFHEYGNEFKYRCGLHEFD